MCSFEWIGLHFKAIFRRLSGAKSREINTEMQFKTPKMHLPEFRNTLYPSFVKTRGGGKPAAPRQSELLKQQDYCGITHWD